MANSSVNFNTYYGLNLILNGQYSTTVYGLTTWVTLTLDGATKSWPAVFIDNKSYNMALTAHEMYHGFGLGHSAVRNADGTVYSGSSWDPVGVGACGFSSCTPNHIPAPQKNELGWIDAAKIYTATLSTQTINLEALALPQTNNYLMATIPLDDSRHFYTVEARRKAGYDTKVAGSTVLIHEVNLIPGAFSNGYIGLIPVPGQPSPGDTGAMWTVGKQPFVDSALGITVTVVNTLTTGFQVRIELPPAQTRIIYVKANAVGANNGSSWTNAYTSLQSALAAANPTWRDRVEVWIAQGTYKPTSGADRNAAFALKNRVNIYGGFSGSETARSQRNIAANPTFLSGDLQGNDNTTISPTEPTRSDNSYHVVTDNVITAVLDGVIITGGNANGDGSTTPDDGGGLYSSGSPTLRNVTLKDNTALRDGGGLLSSGGSPSLVNVAFLRNRTHYRGGGIANFNNTPRLAQVIFSGNDARYQGGGLYTLGSNVTLINTTFYSNTATYYSNSEGGGIYNYGAASAPTNVTIANSILWGNTDKVNGSGAAAAQLAHNAYGAFSVSYSLVQGGYTGAGNISSNPLFIDADGPDNTLGTLDDNLRLQNASPAIDAGSNSAVPTDAADVDDNNNTTEQISYDMDGRARFVAHLSTGPLLVDMGPYEAPTASGGDNFSVCLPIIVKN